jgi:hypothetical protein
MVQGRDFFFILAIHLFVHCLLSTKFAWIHNHIILPKKKDNHTKYWIDIMIDYIYVMYTMTEDNYVVI